MKQPSLENTPRSTFPLSLAGIDTKVRRQVRRSIQSYLMKEYAKQFSSTLLTEVSLREILSFFPLLLKRHFIYEWNCLWFVSCHFYSTGDIGTKQFLLFSQKITYKKNERKKWFENSLERLHGINPTLWYSFSGISACTLTSGSVAVSLVYSRERK